MGSPVSPHLANLFRYVVEAKFIEEMLAAGHKELALACEHTFVYIDDLCTFGDPLPTEKHYGIPMTKDVISDKDNSLHSRRKPLSSLPSETIVVAFNF